MTTFIINIPDNLAKEAKEAGLLDSTASENMLRENLRRHAIDGLFAAADKLAHADFQVMTMDEIQQEVNVVREQRRQRAAGP